MRKGFAALLLSALLCTALFSASCGFAADDTEAILASFSEKAPLALELYDVIYGDALPYGIEEPVSGYYAVLSSARFQSVSDIREALREVFSEGYTKVLENTAFSGVSADEGSISPKFSEYNGILCIAPSATSGFGTPREFDFSTARVVKQSRYQALLTVTSSEGEELDINMRKENGEWMIDSAIF